MTALSLTLLTKSFRAGTPGCSATVSVLRCASLALWPGEIVALDGARGCGKSTLLRCAAGQLRADSGEVRWFGARAPACDAVAYVSSESGADRGALYARLECAVARRCRVLLVDDLALAESLERRLAISLLRRHASAGGAILIATREATREAGAAGDAISSAHFITRAVTLAHGEIVQRRKRSAARIAASSPASRARTSARSTYGRNLRSPQ